MRVPAKRAWLKALKASGERAALSFSASASATCFPVTLRANTRCSARRKKVAGSCQPRRTHPRTPTAGRAAKGASQRGRRGAEACNATPARALRTETTNHIKVGPATQVKAYLAEERFEHVRALQRLERGLAGRTRLYKHAERVHLHLDKPELLDAGAAPNRHQRPRAALHLERGGDKDARDGLFQGGQRLAAARRAAVAAAHILLEFVLPNFLAEAARLLLSKVLGDNERAYAAAQDGTGALKTHGLRKER